MSKSRPIPRLLWIAVVAFLGAPTAAADGRRFVVAVADNHGDAPEVPLHYAESDARNVVETLVGVGGVSPANTLLLSDVDADDLRQHLDQLTGRLLREGWGPHDALFFYISSHAGDGNLHLRDTRFPMRELRDLLSRLPVGVAVLILDTCESGAATREKGLVPISGPVVQINRPGVTGRVIIASSGPQEASFESEAIQGSFFTHHLLAGLRGAADVSHDGAVSLQEAFNYAYARTIESTLGNERGIQTPQYDTRLSGEGEFVMTQPALGRGRLRIAVDHPAEFVLSPLNGGPGIVRFSKATGPVVLATDPGAYSLRQVGSKGTQLVQITVPENGEVVVREGDFAVQAGPRDKWRRKGASEAPWLVTVGGGITTMAVSAIGPTALASISVRRENETRAFGGTYSAVTVGYGQASPAGDSGFVQREVSATASVGLVRYWRSLQFYGGVEAGGAVVHQQGAGSAAPASFEPRAGVRAGAAWPLSELLALDLSIAPGAEFASQERGLVVVPAVASSLGLGLRF